MIELIKLATSAATIPERQATQPRAVEAPPPAASTRTATEEKSAEERRAEVERMREAIERLAGVAFAESKLSIERADDAGLFVYRLVDSDTGSVVRQWPQQELVELKEYLRTRQAGLVDQRA